MKRRRTTAGELLARLEQDPAYLARQAERAERVRIAVEEDAREQRRLLEECAEAGFDIGSVWDLVNRANDYDRLIPILARHLRLTYSPPTIDGIARALALRAARPYWVNIAATFLETPADSRAKQGLACALAMTASADVVDELHGLLMDPQHGESRILLVDGLRRVPKAKAEAIREELRQDPLFAKRLKHVAKRTR